MATLTGTAGDDSLVGGAGDDLFELDQGGDDTARGGDGDDDFNFGELGLNDADHVDGGAGSDTVKFVATEPLTLTGDMLVRIERIDVQSGSDGQITLDDDVVAAGRKLSVRGAELDGWGLLFDGSAETDGQLSVVGSGLGDSIAGGQGWDTLSGGQGSDIPDGGTGTDQLVGGADGDVMTGGDGADHFLFRAITDSKRNTPDSITDLEEQDVVDVRQIDANVLKDGNQAFHLSGHWEGGAGLAVVFHNVPDDHWVLLLDVDGDARPDASIDLGILSFTPSNFVL